MKLPAYVNLESKPFEPDHYRETLDDDVEEKTPWAAKDKMIGIRNTIRWRWITGPDGEPVSA
jgi:RNA polymerase-associated protein LEO1